MKREKTQGNKNEILNPKFRIGVHEGCGGKCSEILATIKLLYNPRVN